MTSRYQARVGILFGVLFYAAAVSAFSPARASEFSFTWLGYPVGGYAQYAESVSADGSVVVGEYGGDSDEAYVWTAATGPIVIGDLPGGLDWSVATGVSDDGKVVAGAGHVGNSQSDWSGFRWTSEDGMVDIGSLPGGGSYVVPRGISGDGTVIVGQSASSLGHQAFRWTASEGMVGLGDLSGGLYTSMAWDASYDGSVIVGDGMTDDGTVAFRWTSGTGMEQLALPDGYSQSDAYGVSGDGSVIVGVMTTPSYTHQAFRWTSTEGMVGLGSLGGGSHYSAASGVSQDGSVIVGNSTTADYVLEAFLWTSNLGMVSLGQYLLDHGVSIPDSPFLNSPSELSYAYAVSADGRTIVGGNPYVGGAWVATIPEPSSYLLTAIGLAGLCVARLRRQRKIAPSRRRCPNGQPTTSHQ